MKPLFNVPADAVDAVSNAQRTANALFEQRMAEVLVKYRELWQRARTSAEVVYSSHDGDERSVHNFAAFDPSNLGEPEHDALTGAPTGAPEYVPASWLGGAAMQAGLNDGALMDQLALLDKALMDPENRDIGPGVRKLAMALRLDRVLNFLGRTEVQAMNWEELERRVILNMAAGPSFVFGGMLTTMSPMPVSLAQAAGRGVREPAPSLIVDSFTSLPYRTPLEQKPGKPLVGPSNADTRACDSCHATFIASALVRRGVLYYCNRCSSQTFGPRAP